MAFLKENSTNLPMAGGHFGQRDEAGLVEHPPLEGALP